jgi:hypothetical protein
MRVEMENSLENPLTTKQLKAVAALLTTNTREEAAKAAGVSPATLYRWLKEPGFREEYRAERYRVVERVLGELLARSSAAIAVLGDGLEDPDINARLRAARSVLDYVLKGTELERKIRELDELEERVEELEALLHTRRDDR